MMRKEISRETLVEAIHIHSAIIFSQINFKEAAIAIHLNINKRNDYPRMMLALFTLGRVYEHSLPCKEMKGREEDILKLFWDIFEKANKECEPHERIYVLLYGMRFLNAVKQPYGKLLDIFKTISYETLYAYPVSVYVYMSTYIECENLRQEYDFSKEIFAQCKKVFDFLLYTRERETFQPFYFSELSACKAYVESSLLTRAVYVSQELFDNGYLKNSSTRPSGVAKCMEDFARRGDMMRFDSCLSFLETRKLSRFSIYMSPDQASHKDFLFTEDEYSQHVCLDTNAHLVNAYLNLYEKN
jgi:hypothetical protein